MISQKRIKELSKLRGRVRGDVIITDFKYIRDRQGKQAMDKLNQELKKVNKDLDYYKIKNTVWLPVSWKVLLLENAKKTFKWKDKDFFDLGHSASSNSFITRTLLRYFVSVNKTFKESAKYWQKYWQVGELDPYYLDVKKKYLILRLKKFKLHPDLCPYMKGHFLAFAEMILRNDNINIEETKCNFRGDSFHEFKIQW